MLSKPLEETLSQAFRLARERRYEYVTLEVLLRMLIEDAEARPVLLGCGANLEQLARELERPACVSVSLTRPCRACPQVRKARRRPR